MSLPSQEDIAIEAKSGNLIEAILGGRWECSYREIEALADVIAAAHNEGIINLLKLLPMDVGSHLSEHKRAHGIMVLGHCLGKVDAPVASLLDALNKLASCGVLGASSSATALLEWCSGKPDRPFELLKCLDEDGIIISDIRCLSIALQCGLKIDNKYFSERSFEFLRSGSNMQKIESIQALVEVSFVDESDWDRAVESFRCAHEYDSADGVRGALLRTALSWLKTAPSSQIDAVKDLVRLVCTPLNGEVIKAIVYVLAFEISSLDEEFRRGLLGLLAEYEYEFEFDGEVFDLLDFGLKNIISSGDAMSVRKLVERLLLRDASKISFDKFDSVILALHEDRSGQIEEWVVSWLRSGEFRLCHELSAGLFERASEYRFDIDFSLYNLSKVEYCFVARKAVATFFLRPVAMSTLLVSLARTAPEEVFNELQDLLVDTVLVNYPSLVEKVFQTVVDDPDHQAAPLIGKALERFSAYMNGLSGIGFVPELQPSEHERQIAWQHRSDEMADAIAKARRQSILSDLVSEQVLLYGNGFVSWVKPFCPPGEESLSKGPSRRIEQGLHSISHQVEIPREEVIDPVSLHLKLMRFRNERRPQ